MSIIRDRAGSGPERADLRRAGVSAAGSDFSWAANSRLTIQVIPAITRQAALRILDPGRTDTVAEVAARALSTFGLPADLVCLGVEAFDRIAWDDRDEERGESAASESPHWCVRSGEVLVDPCLDLLSVPGGSLSLRPSWFDLPPMWAEGDRVAFRQRQTGSVVRYWRTDVSGTAPVDLPPPALVDALVDEVVESSRSAVQTLSDALPAPARWLAITG